MNFSKPDQVIDRAYALMEGLAGRSSEMDEWMQAVRLGKLGVCLDAMPFIGRDNNTFRRLPEDPTEALAIVMEDFDDGHTYANLYSHRFPTSMLPEVRGRPSTERAAYEIEARQWLEAHARLTTQYGKGASR
jgi:hypothetical protein